MTEKQKKLVENYIRKEVRKRLNESIDPRKLSMLVQKLIDDIDAISSGVVADETEIPRAIVAYLKKAYSI